MITLELLNDIRAQFHINWSGVHGISHWARVYEIGVRLADKTGADCTVTQLFSVFHDACRYSEGADPLHGPRGAELALKYRTTHLRALPDDAFARLYEACRLHTSSATHEDITVRTCFDSDRLDLGRVGTTPDPNMLCTEAAQSADMIAWALKNGERHAIPDNILGRYITTGRLSAASA